MSLRIPVAKLFITLFYLRRLSVLGRGGLFFFFDFFLGGPGRVPVVLPAVNTLMVLRRRFRITGVRPGSVRDPFGSVRGPLAVRTEIEMYFF